MPSVLRPIAPSIGGLFAVAAAVCSHTIFVITFISICDIFSSEHRPQGTLVVAASWSCLLFLSRVWFLLLVFCSVTLLIPELYLLAAPRPKALAAPPFPRTWTRLVAHEHRERTCCYKTTLASLFCLVNRIVSSLYAPLRPVTSRSVSARLVGWRPRVSVPRHLPAILSFEIVFVSPPSLFFPSCRVAWNSRSCTDLPRVKLAPSSALSVTGISCHSRDLVVLSPLKLCV